MLALDPPESRPGAASVDEHERRRDEECKGRGCERQPQPAPLPPCDHDQRNDSEYPRILRGGRETNRHACELEASRDEQSERKRDERRQRHVRHGCVRVRDVRRVDGGHGSGDNCGERAVRGGAEPPRGADTADGERHDHESSREVGRLAVPRLEGSHRVRHECRPVEEVRIEAAAVRHPPRPGHHVLLVGIENRPVREAVLDADQPHGGGPGEDRAERCARPSPVRSVRRQAARHRRARRRFGRARSPRPHRAARVRPPAPA